MFELKGFIIPFLLGGSVIASVIDFDDLSGGADQEIDESLFSRVLQSRANPTANFNIGAIEKRALAIAGVTRVFTKRITPYIGAVTVAFMRDNDINPIPNGDRITEVKNDLITILPAQSDINDLYVIAPVAITVGFTFTTLDPNTPTMKTAITENLIAFFEDNVTYEQSITEDNYRGAINQTIDPTTGGGVSSFTLSTPSGTISISTNEIGVLGSIIYP